jgi:hypothetical protein
MKRQDDEVARVGTEVGDSQFKYALWCHRFLFQENDSPPSLKLLAWRLILRKELIKQAT